MMGNVMSRAIAPVGAVDDLDTAYRKLQVLIGVLAVTLVPIAVGVDEIFGDHDGLRGSVSAYYYGRGGNWFVGSLFAMAVFFVTYEYAPRSRHDVRKWDNVQSTAAAVCALGVALFPIPSEPPRNTRGEEIIGHLHMVSATALFVFMAIFSLYHFTKTAGEAELDLDLRGRLWRFVRTDWAALRALDPGGPAPYTPDKVVRNRIYRLCGWTIVAASLSALVAYFGELDRLFFWSEVAGITAFGFSWLVKGEAFWIVNDSPTKALAG